MANIDTKFEFWKNRLLDLGKRNRLINCPLPKSIKRTSRASLLISQPDYKDLWAEFSENGKSLSFSIPEDTYYDDKNEDEDEEKND